MSAKMIVVAVSSGFLACSTGALGAATDNDANTGLWTYIYYAPIADLIQEGLPVSQKARDYARLHGLKPTLSDKSVR